VINQNLVRGLKDQTADFEQRVAQAEAELGTLRAFAGEVMPHLIADRLAGVEVVIVSQEGTDGGAIAASRLALERAGADMLGLLTVSDRMALTDESSRVDLAEIVEGSSTEDPDALAAEAAELMASELAFGPASPAVLPELIRQEFLLVGGREAGDSVLRSLDGDEAVVLVAGGSDRPVIDPGQFLVPLIEDLVEDGAAVAAAEGFETRYPFVTLLRDDGAVANQIATQDNVDQVPGQVGLVLAVEDVLAGTAGHYGVKGVDQVIPPP
jgi:hypothetical protein